MGSKELFTDVYNRMYLDSAPELRRFLPKKRVVAKPCRATDDDRLFETFLATENTIPYL